MVVSACRWAIQYWKDMDLLRLPISNIFTDNAVNDLIAASKYRRKLSIAATGFGSVRVEFCRFEMARTAL